MRTLISLVIAFIFVATLSCQKEQPTKYTQNIDMNTILNDTNWVEVTDTLSINIECLDYSKLAQNYIIKDTNEYNSLYSAKWIDDIYKDCSTYILPNINFNNYTLLGLLTLTGPGEIKRMLFKNDIEKKYIYNIEITIAKKEYMLMTNQNWLLIPKISKDFNVIFDTTMKYNYQ